MSRRNRKKGPKGNGADNTSTLLIYVYPTVVPRQCQEKPTLDDLHRAVLKEMASIEKTLELNAHDRKCLAKLLKPEIDVTQSKGNVRSTKL